jgi:hypothetical protein
VESGINYGTREIEFVSWNYPVDRSDQAAAFRPRSVIDREKADLLAAWMNAVIEIHGEKEARRVWRACTSEKRPAPVVHESKEPPKPIGWLK